MFNPVKEFTSPKFVVGLMIDGGFFSAVRVYKARHAVEIDHIAVRAIGDPAHGAEALRDFFQSEDLKNDALVTCLPASGAFVRLIPLSIQDPRKLDKIIKYQMEPYVPHPVDDLVVDFLAPGPGKDIVAAGVPKGALAEHLAGLARAGLDPKVVGLDDMALFFLYLYCRSGKAGVVINMGRQKRMVQVIQEDRMEFIRILPGGGPELEEIAETLGIYRLKNPGASLGDVLLTGDLARDGEMAEAVASRIKTKVSLWRPFDEIKHGLGEVPDEMQTRLSVPLGLALSLADPSAGCFDLRREEFAVRSSVTPRGMTFYALTVLILLGFLTFNLYYKLSVRETHARALKQEMGEVFRKTFPDARNIIKGREPAQMRQRIEEETGKYQWLENMTGQGAVLAVLKVVTESLVGFSDVKIDNLSIEGKEIRLDGQASSFETVDRLEKKLAGAGSFTTIKLVGAKMDKRAQAVTFNFAIEKRP